MQLLHAAPARLYIRVTLLRVDLFIGGDSGGSLVLLSLDRQRETAPLLKLITPLIFQPIHGRLAVQYALQL